MATTNGTAFCPNCNRQVLTVRRTPNHVLHLLICFLTCGLWVFVWMLLSIAQQPNKCTSCGMETARTPNVGLAITIAGVFSLVCWAWYALATREPAAIVEQRRPTTEPRAARPVPTAIQVADLPPLDPSIPSPFGNLPAPDNSDVIRKRIEAARESKTAAKVYQLREWTFTNRPPLKGRLRQFGPVKTQIEEENYDLHEFNTADLSKESRAFISANLN